MEEVHAPSYFTSTRTELNQNLKFEISHSFVYQPQPQQPPNPYECPTILLVSYNSSRYFSSSSLSTFPLTSNASSILPSLLNPIIGLVTLLLIHASATVLILQPCFSANSCTRAMILRSVSVDPVDWFAASFSPAERVVEPNCEGGRARWPRQRGAHYHSLRQYKYIRPRPLGRRGSRQRRLTGISPTPVLSQNRFISLSSSLYNKL